MDKNTSKKFETLIYECLVDAIKSLKEGVIYKAEDVFPSEIWNITHKYEHRKLGLFLSRFVKQGRLEGLKRIQNTSENHSQYIFG